MGAGSLWEDRRKQNEREKGSTGSDGRAGDASPGNKEAR
jgi:hypothetical protein